jgi:putative toxin-antitoxin system antitoxin component (TIGR02293 family)
MPFSLRWAAFFLTLCFPCGLPHLSYTIVLKEMIMQRHIDAPVPAQQARALYESMALYGFDTDARIALIRRGIPASTISRLSARMGMSKEFLLSSLGLSRATISRKEKDASLLSKDESERVLGVETLIGMVQAMVEQSGDPAGFDAARWVSDWLSKPLPALAGATPASYMDTFEGQKLVAELLSMTQSGAYA